MNILDQIVAFKKKEVEGRKNLTSINQLEKSIYFNQPNISFKKNLLDPEKTGIIAEFKRKSPSKGIINANVTAEEVTQGYETAGASAVSVLTDQEFFGGSDTDLINVRGTIGCPILRKDFILEEYQIVEARSMGANIILLIAAILDTTQIKTLSEFTHSLGMEVLLEVHNEEELLCNLYDSIDVIGVNNRNLKDFSLNIGTSIKLAENIPSKYLKISESGIHDPETIVKLKSHGFNGFLIGENFMKTADPGAAMLEFVGKIKQLESNPSINVNPA